MSGVEFLLAALGVAALLVRLGRAGVRSALRVAEVTAARGLVGVSLRRGDLTGVSERRAAERRARRGRNGELLIGAIWALWLIVPLFTPWTAEAYAVAAPLWLIRSAPLRGRGRT